MTNKTATEKAIELQNMEQPNKRYVLGSKLNDYTFEQFSDGSVFITDPYGNHVILSVVAVNLLKSFLN